MATVHYNPSTGKIGYKAANNQVQMVGKLCNECPEGTTPVRVRVAFNGIVPYNGFNNCCPAASYDDSRKIIEPGIGWNFEVVLEQGRIYLGTNDIYWSLPLSVHPCSFSNVKEEDFGSYNQYALNACQGTLLGTSHFWKRGVRLTRINSVDWPQFNLWMVMACTALDEPYNRPDGWNLFNFSGMLADVGYEGSECFPYGCVIPNQYLATNAFCIGGGTAVLTKLE